MTAKGASLPVHRCLCRVCGVVLLRKTYWRSPRCAECGRKARDRDAAAELALVRSQARGMRIILTECGYDWARFAEFRADLRTSNIHDLDHACARAYRFDKKLFERAQLSIAGSANATRRTA